MAVLQTELESTVSMDVREQLVSDLMEMSMRTNLLKDTLYKVMPTDSFEAAITVIHDIKATLAQSEQFIREEHFESLGHEDKRKRTWNLHELPPDFEVDYGEASICIRTPLWALGPAKIIDSKLSFHNNRPYVRDHVFWDAIASRLITEGALSVRGQSEFTDVTFSFFTRNIDHPHLINPNVEVVIGALAANHLVAGEAPFNVNIHLKWINVSQTRDEHIEIEVSYR